MPFRWHLPAPSSSTTFRRSSGEEEQEEESEAPDEEAGLEDAREPEEGDDEVGLEDAREPEEGDDEVVLPDPEFPEEELEADEPPPALEVLPADGDALEAGEEEAGEACPDDDALLAGLSPAEPPSAGLEPGAGFALLEGELEPVVAPPPLLWCALCRMLTFPPPPVTFTTAFWCTSLPPEPPLATLLRWCTTRCPPGSDEVWITPGTA